MRLLSLVAALVCSIALAQTVNPANPVSGGAGPTGPTGPQGPVGPATTNYAQIDAGLVLANSEIVTLLDAGTINAQTINQNGVQVLSAVSAPGAASDSNGATISNGAFALEYADGTHPGLLSTTTQTIAGLKTLNGGWAIPSSVKGCFSGAADCLQDDGSGNLLASSWIAVSTNKALGLNGAGESVYLTYNGSQIAFVGAALNAGSGISMSATISTTGTMQAGALTHLAGALPTCAAGIEGQVIWDSTSGVNTGHRTRLCLCRSSGSNAYTWQNLAGASLTDVGTSTTCPD